jgi:hypothetical protein
VEKDTTHVALDDSERKIVAGILGREATEPEVQIPNDPRHIRRLFDRLKAEERVQACYEAGVCRGTTSTGSSPHFGGLARGSRWS